MSNGCFKGQEPLSGEQWLGDYANRCYFYPGRDCPGWNAGGICSRISDQIPDEATDDDAD